MSETVDFQTIRRTGIGGSDAAAAIGVSPWRTPYDLWMEKLGEASPLSEPTERMRWGTLLEPIIIDEYSRRTGRAVHQPPMLRHPSYPWMIGHVDGQVIGERRLLEAKCAGIGIGWGAEGTDEIPLQYLTQVHHYLVVAEALVADVAVLIGGNDFRIYTVERDDDIAGALVDQEHAFWQHVEQREPPDPINTKDAVRRWGRLTHAGNVVASEDDQEAITELRQIRAERIELDAREEAFKIQVMKSLGESGDTLVNLAGVPLATWKLDKGRKAYTKTVEAQEPRRRFLLKD